MATAEAAIALGALTVVFGLVLAGIAVVVDQVRCTDAAREAARAAARGQPQLAERVVAELGPPGARLTVHVDGDLLAAEVAAAPAGGLLPGAVVRASAVAAVEPIGGPHGQG
ncbi:TadE family type IV pilus minor pilin [Amycolatopsis suaedae]|uniref:Pilus assembly protein n=1 Tax=Amycolatopsis suaedae TaxID=2510978 RepID=A0A4Q7J315_9PSEU|nr:TadE family type IV pilus minor pilin [Amycolatopsis suaedae]RZQ61860.1 pilus assembly protein [Amycolatopsis suaedae]